MEEANSSHGRWSGSWESEATAEGCGKTRNPRRRAIRRAGRDPHSLNAWSMRRPRPSASGTNAERSLAARCATSQSLRNRDWRSVTAWRACANSCSLAAFAHHCRFPYLTTTEPLEMRCAEGHSWTSRFDRLKAGRWCGKCARTKHHS